jgi:hypothetical protein
MLISEPILKIQSYVESSDIDLIAYAYSIIKKEIDAGV